MDKITADMVYKFFIVISFVAAISTSIALISGGLPFNMDPQTVAGFVGDSIGDTMAKIVGAF